MTLIEFVNDIKKCKVQRNILSTQIEGISNELASSKIQDQMNDIEALNEKESDKVRLNQELNDLIPYKKFAIPYSNNLWPSFGSAWNQIMLEEDDNKMNLDPINLVNNVLNRLEEFYLFGYYRARIRPILTQGDLTY
ncbi:hypothetical protein GLOIN_2v1477501 [Rhizophagus irregularis DAOM 181602=DAOM 197198]|uniref:Uncharacterized protein n=1 Tax=Rhizophagus irregularis (strain DAOM 181602 / DAOM 197198 / MUCL 43194) TaxID=747089 RepID=A0A2P4Q505_RHIID|nr:hypothetical protein GLOIN_2v1477501 [Rhizophagus irregularis DAOM 181602=DAOM 197198]POG72735.1 hypothetical protein GLOIN_2v1477501 [Rhizophagus irregularis DAOM 181602=DAOM 197198]|eukprot:XP_025179601.1 hypothetical protein GLOIN_2v1477501 [Rhizophagus irregularis DAOM 181602=DAOM 197198]